MARDEPAIGLELGRFLAKAYELKAEADYGLDVGQITSDQARTTLEEARSFVSRIADYLESQR